MRIGRWDSEGRALIVAEIGNNHEGRPDVAEEMVRQAAACGVDAVKFQTFQTEKFVRRADAARFARLKSFELSYPQFERLAGLARSLGLLFLSTPLDLDSADFLDGIVDAFKIASGDNTFYPLLERVAATGKPVVISTGLSDLDQVKRSVACVEAVWRQKGVGGDLAVLHCVCSYPAPPDQLNLQAIPSLAKTLNCLVGYSDHALGIEACVLAAALGARIIEKHFTLDKAFSDFRDHQLSADPADMKALVERVRAVPVLLGTEAKGLQPCEEALAVPVRRSIFASRDLSRGTVLAWDDLVWLRPGTGLAPGNEHLLVGRTLVRDVAAGEPLSESDVGA